MEVITMLKFWKSNNNSKVAAGTTSSDGETFAGSTISDHLSDYSDDDDFFELELDSKHTLSSPSSKTTSLKKSFNFEDNERENEVKLKSKPQSPISILRAAASPKLQVFMFGRFNKKSKHSEEVFDSESVSSPKRSNSSLFTVKFRIEDGSIVPKLTQSGSNNNSSSVSSSPKIEKQSSDNFNESSKRFSKDSIQKYINRMKPKPSKNSNIGEKFIASPTRPSMASFPSMMKKEKDEKHTTSSRFKVKSSKQLGKCKPASAMIGVNQSPTNLAARNECPQDGIEGAILHCKRSFSSSIGYSSLSRCSSDPSHEKSIQVSEVI